MSSERNWTQLHLRWLSTVAFQELGSGPALDDFRRVVEAPMIRRGVLERQIGELLLPLSPCAVTARRVICMRGIDTITVAALCAEIDDFERFKEHGHEVREPARAPAAR
jgi:hypothetical protein